ncbi:MAG: hypothetical protein FRX49_07283 [Trebouxia sp. A1-2]|nr:MAG: hypothetical protein FRX49_07283 [Trebouxia sp. A1-2]
MTLNYTETDTAPAGKSIEGKGSSRGRYAARNWAEAAQMMCPGERLRDCEGCLQKLHAVPGSIGGQPVMVLLQAGLVLCDVPALAGTATEHIAETAQLQTEVLS